MRPFLFFFVLAIGLLGNWSVKHCLSKGVEEVSQIPINEQPTGSIFPGKIVWHDLLTSDLKGAAEFYEELFGWQIVCNSHSATIRNKGRLIATIIEVEKQVGRMEAVWLPYISVQDVDETSRLLQKEGGKIIKGPMNMRKRGRVSLVEDSQGSHFVIIRTTGGDPKDRDPEISDWLWDEVWSFEPKSLGNFYELVLGYGETDSSFGDYTILVQDGKWRAGIRHVEKTVKNLLWVPVIRVEDPVETAKRAEELGGQVLLSPDQMKNTGNVALLKDSVGAFLLIQRWMPEASEGGRD